MINAYSNWFSTAKISLSIPTPFIPIWGNPDIKIPFDNELFKINFLFLQDLFDHRGVPLTKIQMETKTERPIMLTTYFSLWKGMPTILIDQLKNVPRVLNLQEPPIVNYLKKCKKGTSIIRQIWDSKKLPSSILVHKNGLMNLL